MLRTRQATLIAVIVGAASPYLAVDRSSAAGPRSADPIVYTIWRSTLPSAFDVSRRLQDVQGPAAPRDRQGQKSHQMKQVFVTSPQRSVADDSWLRDNLPITKGSLSRSHEPSVTALPLNARRFEAELRWRDLVTFDDAIRPEKGCAREPWERRDASGRREIAPKAPKSAAARRRRPERARTRE